ncbi:MAG: primosomal protein N' [Flavobacteriales bacterium]
MSHSLEYIDVIVPLSVDGIYQYAIEKSEGIQIGQRVIVQFGIKKLYTAVVVNITNEKSEGFKIKKVVSVLDKESILETRHIKFWMWLSKYYIANIGDVMSAALPNSLKLASETRLKINDFISSKLDDKEQEVINAINHKPNISIKQIKEMLSFPNYFKIINKLIDKEIISVHEFINKKYSEKLISQVILNKIDGKLSLTSKQNELYEFLKLNKDHTVLSDLIKKSNISKAVFKSLEKKKVIAIKKVSISRITPFLHQTKPIHKLSNEQSVAYKSIKQNFREKDVCLLHGVTSSGKTEIYIKLIEKEIQKGKQVLYLLPEIALTIQIVRRLQKHFGDKVGVFHSNLNNSERVEVWKSISGNCSVLLGVRSSIFLPFRNLGLIIIDEEHDSSYKQQQPSPRYHARDAAIYLASLYNAKVLLGSATPAIESYYNAMQGKFGFVELLKRYSDIKLPKIEAVDLKKGFLKKEMTGFFSKKLIDEISIQLELNKQIILFQNKRGYSKVLSCDSCGLAVSCKYCSVSLTFHKSFNQLKCHYCGYVESLENNCKSCNSNSFTRKGFGTEHIVESLQEIFPDHKISRMDHDTTRRKNAYEEIILDFQQSNIDILVGTQMIAKGFDFDNVSLVGIIDADSMLNYPDFRSHERAFQLLSQVSGRAGRKEKQGKVILQTYNPDHEILDYVTKHSFNKFYNLQISERKTFNYPPFSKLLIVRFRHTDHYILDKVTNIFSTFLRDSFNDRVLGPEYPVISKVKNYFIKNIMLKIEVNKSYAEAKKIVSLLLSHMKSNKLLEGCVVQIDVDPN